jgi:hypothetical protein
MLADLLRRILSPRPLIERNIAGFVAGIFSVSHHILLQIVLFFPWFVVALSPTAIPAAVSFCYA